MSSARGTLLIQYRYDPLDRLADCSPTELPSHQRFYQKSRLATEIHGQIKHSFFQEQGILLAQQQRQGTATETTLLATDLQRSVLHTVKKTQQSAIVYAPYGHRAAGGGLLSLLGFNGERTDPVTGHYLLGNGYRVFNPVLMRFNSPDSISPFGRGGLNAYAYAGDPINTVDPTGHFGIFHAIRSLWKGAQNILRMRTPGGAANATGVVPQAAAAQGPALQQIAAHGVDLLPPMRGEFPDFFVFPTERYQPIARPLPKHFSIPLIEDLDVALNVLNSEIISNERAAIAAFEGGRITVGDVEEISLVLDRKRRVFDEGFNRFQQVLRARVPPPAYEAPPSYETVVNNAGGIRNGNT